MLSIPVMEGIVFVYIFRAISFAGHLNEYSQFACLQQLIHSFLFANVNESLATFLRNMDPYEGIHTTATSVALCSETYLEFQYAEVHRCEL